MVIRDLRIYAEAGGGEVFHYRHHDTGNEIGSVIEMPYGSIGAFEIKLGVNQIDSAAKSLLATKTEISKHTDTGGPDILCIICGLSNFAYRREDGVFVVPLTALKD